MDKLKRARVKIRRALVNAQYKKSRLATISVEDLNNIVDLLDYAFEGLEDFYEYDPIACQDIIEK